MPSPSFIISRRRARREESERGLTRVWRTLSTFALTTISVALIVVIGAGIALAQAYSSYIADLPSADRLQKAFSSSSSNEFFQTTKLYDRTGTVLLYEVIDPRAGDRQWMSIGKIPKHFINATIASEDKTFYTNPGYDLEGILRAFVSNARGGATQGGSTITQQLVKNVIIPADERAVQSYERKLREVLIAAEATNRYSKDQILEWYLNTNFYGNLAYGVDAAARVYFGKSASELTLAESAMLIAIPQSPTITPISKPKESKARQEIILEVMAREGFITASQAQAAKQEDVLSKIKSLDTRFNVRAPHFSVYAVNDLVKLVGTDLTYRGGLKVITSIDLNLQDQAECLAKSQVQRLSGNNPNAAAPTATGKACEAAALLAPPRAGEANVNHDVSNASIVMIDPRNGQVLAMVGSLDYWNEAINGKFNVAADGKRQPGSSFKPFTYLTAFSQGYTPSTMVLDVRTSYPQQGGVPYVPENYDRQFHGPVSLRIALARSYNLPAVEMMNRVGVDNVIRTAHRMGINTLDRESSYYGLALTLGGGEVSLLDMAYAYSVMANKGQMVGQPVTANARRSGYRALDPIVILRVEDAKGNVLNSCGEDGNTACQFDRPQTQQVLSEQLAYLITNILSDEQARIGAFGHPNPLEIDRPAAAKTGTTNDFLDNWTMGYTPQLVVGVWVGNTDSKPMKNVSGLTGAAPIWNALMKYSVKQLGLPPEGWKEPQGVAKMRVCYPSGLLPSRICQSSVNEVFISGTEPHSTDNVWQEFEINRETGKLATVFTPQNLVEKKVFQVLPPEASDWIRETGLPQPPNEYDTIQNPNDKADVAILSPSPFGYVRGEIVIKGTVKPENFQLFKLQFGPGLNPTKWTQIGDDRKEKIENDELGKWNTTGLNGLYTIQLVALKLDQTFAVSTMQVTVDNTPPNVKLLAPTDNQEFQIKDESIIIQPDAKDNLSLSFVEIYVDDKKVATNTVAPFTTRWKMTAGKHVIYVKAIDAAGNEAESKRVTVGVK